MGPLIAEVTMVTMRSVQIAVSIMAMVRRVQASKDIGTNKTGKSSFVLKIPKVINLHSSKPAIVTKDIIKTKTARKKMFSTSSPSEQEVDGVREEGAIAVAVVSGLPQIPTRAHIINAIRLMNHDTQIGGSRNSKTLKIPTTESKKKEQFVAEVEAVA